jgi:hypothetical protein
MSDGIFQFEDCLLKHYIRRDVWLPQCRERRNSIRKVSGNKAARRLRYFTFCAVGALDVLLLDREGIIRRSVTKEFDTVCFFDRDDEAVAETRKRIPGARGFPGDFVEVLLETPDGGGLKSPTAAQNTIEERKRQRNQAQRQLFIETFPFDVINLDLEQYLYRPREALPGKLTAALRELLQMQKREGQHDGKPYEVQEFTMMFTTQVGPPNLPGDYLSYLRDTCLQQNIDQYPELQEPFLERSGGKGVADFFSSDFDGAFKLAVPKSLIELAYEADWHIDGDRGIEVYQFDRDSKDGQYRMLHMSMVVKRQNPPSHKRAPGQKTSAEAELRKAINQLFSTAVVPVDNLVKGSLEKSLQTDLQSLFKHRKHYYDPLAEK